MTRRGGKYIKDIRSGLDEDTEISVDHVQRTPLPIDLTADSNGKPNRSWIEIIYLLIALGTRANKWAMIKKEIVQACKAAYPYFNNRTRMGHVYIALRIQLRTSTKGKTVFYVEARPDGTQAYGIRPGNFLQPSLGYPGYDEVPAVLLQDRTRTLTHARSEEVQIENSIPHDAPNISTVGDPSDEQLPDAPGFPEDDNVSGYLESMEDGPFVSATLSRTLAVIYPEPTQQDLQSRLKEQLVTTNDTQNEGGEPCSEIFGCVTAPKGDWVEGLTVTHADSTQQQLRSRLNKSVATTDDAGNENWDTYSEIVGYVTASEGDWDSRSDTTERAKVSDDLNIMRGV